MGVNRKNNFFDTNWGCALLCITAIIAIALFWFMVERNHYKYQCTGHTTGKCGWAWCKYYDGSDYLHDFSLHGWPYNNSNKKGN